MRSREAISTVKPARSSAAISRRAISRSPDGAGWSGAFMRGVEQHAHQAAPAASFVERDTCSAHAMRGFAERARQFASDGVDAGLEGEAGAHPLGRGRAAARAQARDRG